MADIFISHIEDEKALAGAVESLLRDVLSPSPTVFLSSNIFTLVGGEQFEERIKKELAYLRRVCGDVQRRVVWEALGACGVRRGLGIGQTGDPSLLWR